MNRIPSLGQTLPVLASVVLLGAGPAYGLEFGEGEFRASIDTTVSLGARWRVGEPDPNLICLCEGGNAFSPNFDDGNLNYGRGLSSFAAKATSDIEFRYKNYSAFIRLSGFYDWEQEQGMRDRTPLPQGSLDRIGTRTDLLDAFIQYDFDLGTWPSSIRAGEQVISWGESTFIQNSINIINHIDVSALRVPGAELREALLAQDLVWFSTNPSDNLTVDLVYQYDWDDTEPDPVGSYFSTNDFAVDGGDTVFLGFGATPDFGAGNDRDDPFNGATRTLSREPKDDGQYGAAFRYFFPSLGAGTEIGFYYYNYHSRVPLISGITGTQEGAALALAAGTAGLILGGAGIGSGLIAGDPVTAIGVGQVAGVGAGAAGADAAAAAALGVDAALNGIPNAPLIPAGSAAVTQRAVDLYADTARYFTEFPEDIKLYGLSFNTEMLGYAVQGEVSYRQDVPLQKDDIELLFAVNGLINPNLALLNQVGNFGTAPGFDSPNNNPVDPQFETYIRGFDLFDTYQFQTTVTKLFPPFLGASQLAAIWEGAISYIPDLPDKDVLRFNGPGTPLSGNPILQAAHGPGIGLIEPAHAFPDRVSWGFRAAARLDYLNALGPINISPRFSFQWDVNGVSPGPGGNFIEGRKAITLGVRATYQNQWEADFSYTNFYGAGRYNLINDRDFVGANVKYSF